MPPQEHFRNPLQELNCNLAKDLSNEITKDLAQHPEDALCIMRSMSNPGNGALAGFPNASDIFTSNPSNNYDANHPTNYYNDANTNSNSYGGDTQSYFNDPSMQRYEGPQQQSNWDRVGNVARDVAPAVEQKIDQSKDDSGGDDGGGSGVWGTVAKIGLGILSFL